MFDDTKYIIHELYMNIYLVWLTVTSSRMYACILLTYQMVLLIYNELYHAGICFIYTIYIK